MKRATAVEPAPPQASGSSWLTPRRVLLLLGVYFLLHALARALVSDSAELDESEQLLWVQHWAWGYGSDPPLYTWLQILTFDLLGTNILALALLKNVLLFSAFAFTYLAAREISEDAPTSVVAMLSLLLFPQVTWESQRDLTHSVLATALASAMFLLAIRIVKRGAPMDYVLLGLAIGLGMLSKYSCALFALALVTAALTMPSLRRVLWNKWMLVTLLVFSVVTAGHFGWALLSPDLALSRSQEVIRENAGHFVHARVVGILSIFRCVAMLGGVLGAVYWITFASRPRMRTITDSALFQQWIRRTFGVVGLICLFVVLVLGIDLRDRWFQPAVFLGAIAAALWAGPRLRPDIQRRFGLLIGALALVVLIVLPGIPLAASATRRPTRLNAPYSALSVRLKGVLPEPGVIVASTRLVGGNLRLWFKHSTVVAPEFHALSLSANVPWLVVWDATKSQAPTPSLAKLVMELTGTNLSEMRPSFVEASYKYTGARTMKLGYVALPHSTPIPARP